MSGRVGGGGRELGGQEKEELQLPESLEKAHATAAAAHPFRQLGPPRR